MESPDSLLEPSPPPGAVDRSGGVRSGSWRGCRVAKLVALGAQLGQAFSQEGCLGLGLGRSLSSIGKMHAGLVKVPELVHELVPCVPGHEHRGTVTSGASRPIRGGRRSRRVSTEPVRNRFRGDHPLLPM